MLRALPLLLVLAGCAAPPSAPAPIDYQGVITPHDMRALHSGRFGELFDRYVKLDPGLGPNTVRLRVYFACLFASQAARVNGDFASVGISYGVAPHVIYDYVELARLGKLYHFIDPFSGTSETGEILAKYNQDAGRVLAQYPEGAPIVVHRALVPDDLPLPIGELAFVHFNTGAWSHEARSLAYFYGKLAPGGVLLIDAYAHAPGHQGLYDAELERLGARAFTLPSGQGVVFK